MGNIKRNEKVRQSVKKGNADEAPAAEVAEYQQYPGGCPHAQSAPYLDPHGGIGVLGSIIGLKVPIEGLFEKTGYIGFFVVSAMSGVVNLHFRIKVGLITGTFPRQGRFDRNFHPRRMVKTDHYV
jgi:hypothetical protein